MTSFECSGTIPPLRASASLVSSLADAWTTTVRPAAQTPATRRSYDGPWAAFVTLAIADGRDTEILPASPELIQAFASYLLTMGLGPSSIRRYLQALRDRHRRCDLPFPLASEEMTLWMRALSRHVGRPPPALSTFSRGDLRSLLLRPSTSPALSSTDQQAILATCLAIAIACRPSELVRIDVCDILYDYFQDPPGTAAVRIWGGKCDIARKGHFPRLGRPRDPRFDIVSLLATWCARWSLLRSPGCSKPQVPKRSCLACGSLFRHFSSGAPRPTSHPHHRWSTSDFTATVRRAAQIINLDPSRFEARSCRMSGISIAAEASLPEYLIALQTGHAPPHSGTNPSTRGYMRVASGSAIFAFWEALEL
jgi:integrase